MPYVVVNPGFTVPTHVYTSGEEIRNDDLKVMGEPMSRERQLLRYGKVMYVQARHLERYQDLARAQRQEQEEENASKPPNAVQLMVEDVQKRGIIPDGEVEDEMGEDKDPKATKPKLSKAEREAKKARKAAKLEASR